MEPVKSRDSKDRIDKRKVPGGDGNWSIGNRFRLVLLQIDKRKVPGGDGNFGITEAKEYMTKNR